MISYTELDGIWGQVTPDRRHCLWIRSSILIGTGAVIGALVAAAWIQVAATGLPHIPPVPVVYPTTLQGNNILDRV